MSELTTAQRSKIRRLSQPRELAPDEEGGELNIVPFLDIVTNIIMFLLATTFVVLAVAEVPTTLAGQGPGTDHTIHDVSVVLVHGGAIVATREGNLDADCEHYTSGRALTVGSVSGHPDWQALDACLAQVKRLVPDETSAVVTADPQVPYEDFIHAMDVARGPDGARFPNVLLSAGVR
jgi:biopolymer transport protein ExbD